MLASQQGHSSHHPYVPVPPPPPAPFACGPFPLMVFCSEHPAAACGILMYSFMPTPTGPSLAAVAGVDLVRVLILTGLV